jgi:hypothetical protein
VPDVSGPSILVIFAPHLIVPRIVYATQKRKKGLRRPYAFRSYASKSAWRNCEFDTSNIPLLQACLACLASPSQFESVKIEDLGRFRDASLSDVDPAIENYYEVCDPSSADGNCVESLLSIGSPTGVLGSGSPPGRKQSSKLRQNTTDSILDHEAARQGFCYKRLADLDIFEDLDDRPNVAVHEMEERFDSYSQTESVKEVLLDWARYLVDRRRKRARTQGWHSFAGLKTPCNQCISETGKSESYDRDELYQHLRQHGELFVKQLYL